MGSVQVAPWGSGKGGLTWSIETPAGGAIVHIIVGHGEVVDALSFVAMLPDGGLVPCPRFGGRGGLVSTIVLDWPNDYVAAIRGTYQNYDYVPDTITSLEFTTKLGKKYGPYGKGGGTAFDLAIEKGAITGFHGHYMKYVNSIGIFARP